MIVTVNDKKYTVKKITAPTRYDAYVLHNRIYEEVPSMSTVIGYAETDEGVLAVCSRRLVWSIVAAAVVCLALAVAIPAMYQYFAPTVEDFNISYSAELVIRDSNVVDINFINGEFPLEITVASLTGESEWVSVEPYGQVQSVTLGFIPSDPTSEAFLVLRKDSYEYALPLILYVDQSYVEFDVYEEGVIS